MDQTAFDGKWLCSDVRSVVVDAGYGEALGRWVDEVERFMGVFREVNYPPINDDTDYCLED